MDTIIITQIFHSAKGSMDGIEDIAFTLQVLIVTFISPIE